MATVTHLRWWPPQSYNRVLGMHLRTFDFPTVGTSFTLLSHLHHSKNESIC